MVYKKSALNTQHHDAKQPLKDLVRFHYLFTFIPLSLRPQGKAKVAEILSAVIRLTLPLLSISVTCSLLSLRLFFRLIKSNKAYV